MSIDIIIEMFAKQNGLIITPDKDDMIELIAAEGNAIKVTGTTELEIQLQHWFVLNSPSRCFCHG